MKRSDSILSITYYTYLHIYNILIYYFGFEGSIRFNDADCVGKILLLGIK